MVLATKTAKDLAPSHDVIVVGSGYGGGVAASRLARMGFEVAVLEQGRNWQAGDFPTTIKARRKTSRMSGRIPEMGDPTGLYHFVAGKGLTVFAATGLGGGSLINAGVVLRPDLDRLRDAGWPEDVVDDGRLSEGFSRAETMLGVGPVSDPERFAKFKGMKKAAEACGAQVQLPSMTITHKAGENAAGVMQPACEHCGDCWSGCNVGAKNTVGVTYIADAVDHGAQIFCQSRVESIAKISDGWVLEVKDLSRSGSLRKITAGMVVLAAGTLGTNEILLRAQRRGLPLSDMLGEQFSANGDDLVFATELDETVNAVAKGYPQQAPERGDPVGPHSMALIDLGDEHGPLWVHDGTMLTVMAKLAPVRELLGFNFGRAMRLLKGGIYGDEQGRVQLYYVVAQDDASGRLRLNKDRVMVDWPEYSSSASRVAAEEKVKTMVEGMGGVFRSNPFVMKAFGGNRIIAHPLGGCAMAETAAKGVVSSDGRVFDPSKGEGSFHDGLFVCDGAAVPSCVGVSPLLTITALAERAMMLIADRAGRVLDVASSPARPVRHAAMPTPNLVG